MADATVKAWWCDICKTVYKDDSYGYDACYDFHIGKLSGLDLHGIECAYPQICLTCAQKISDVVMELEK